MLIQVFVFVTQSIVLMALSVCPNVSSYNRFLSHGKVFLHCLFKYSAQSIGVNLVYMTAPDEKVASQIAQSLVENKHAACVNLVPGVRSFYMWEGKLESSQEVIMLAKTSNVEALTQHVKAIHPYEIPCVLALDVTGGHNPFIDWIRDSCK